MLRALLVLGAIATLGLLPELAPSVGHLHAEEPVYYAGGFKSTRVVHCITTGDVVRENGRHVTLKTHTNHGSTQTAYSKIQPPLLP